MLPVYVSPTRLQQVCPAAAVERPGPNLSPLPLTNDFFFVLIVCLFVLCLCACVCSSFRATGVGRSVRLCVTSLHVYSQRSKWTRYFPPLGVDIGLSAGNSAFSPLVNCSELFKQEALGRKSVLHSFVNKAGSAAVCDNCLEFPFLSVSSVHLECKLFTAHVITVILGSCLFYSNPTWNTPKDELALALCTLKS